MHEEYIQKIFNKCNVGRLLGIEVYEIEEGRAKGKLTIKKEHINVFGNAHGGILFAFADHVGGACGNSLGKLAILVESSIQYMKGVKKGETVFAEATLIHKGKKIGRIDIKVCRENGDLIALMHMVFYMKGDDHKAKTPENL
ncbi:MAG: PaaI family thioesterase [Deltaproteobacteria bacterium]